MASEKETMDKHASARSKNEKDMKEQHHGGHRAEEKSNRSTSKVKMPSLEPGKSSRTTDHDVIRQWVEERGGSPASVKATEGKEDPGLLRINFPGYSGKYSLEDISWEDFFQKFDEKHLEFLYQEQTRTGKTSRFFKLVNSQGGQSRSGSQRKGESRDKEKSRSASKEKS